MNGLVVVESFVTEEEEVSLLERSLKLPIWEQNLRRRVAHFGHKFDYKTLYIIKEPIPSQPKDIVPEYLLDRLIPYFHGQRPNQLTINEYLPGQGIGFHVDTHSAFSDAIAVITLGSLTTMEFRRVPADSQQKYDKVVEKILPRRSLCVFSGEARYGWLHGIKSKKTDTVEGEVVPRGTRISLTFRLLNFAQNFECLQCGFPHLCDTQSPESVRLPERL